MSRLEEGTVAKETLGPLTLRVVQDDSGIGNPRENANVGVIVSWNRDGFGEDHVDGGYIDAYGSTRNYLIASHDALAETIVPLRFVDYGGGWPGTALRVISDLEEADGAIFATPASIEMTGCPPERVDEGLRAEVKEYEQWMQGDVYGYVVEHDGEVLDSCWGYIGDTEYPMEEARRVAESSPEYQRAVVAAFAGSEGLGL